MRHVSDGWGLAICLFVTYLKAAGMARQTVRLRRYYLVRLACDLGTADPWQVEPDDLVAWLGRDGWKPETRKSARASVATFYGWAVETERVTPEANPARRLPRVGVPRGVPRPTPDQIFEDALACANDRDALLLMLAGYAGLRRGEIARVHPADIDHDQQELVVTGKGSAMRRVPIHPKLYAALSSELVKRQRGSCGTGWRYSRYLTPDGYLFPGRVGHVGPDAIGKALARLLGSGWTGHTLRHRFGTRAFSAQRDILAVRDLLGHASVVTTQIYTLTPTDARRLAVLAVA